VWGYAHYKLGYVYWNTGDYAKALQEFKETIEYGDKYATEPNAAQLQKAARKDRPSASPSEPNLKLPNDGVVRLLRDRKGRGGKTVTLPQTDPATGCYAASIVRNREEMRPGRFGVPEPPAGCPVILLNQLDLVLVPGVAFDLLGGRLGRGKGFYDRLLAQVRGHKCGVAFDLQIVSSVPVEPHDIRVDSILTPMRWQPCRSPV
jgi:5-formyltetrahydrofolate cyclo-ligase